MRSQRWATCALTILAALAAAHAAAQDSYSEVRREAQDFNALAAAENSKSALCRSYVGQTVVPTPFATLTQKFASGLSATSTSSPIILTIPVDRDHLRYDAGAGAIFVSAGAFPAAGFSAAIQAEVISDMALLSAKIDAPMTGGIKIALGESQRVLGTEMGRNILGQPVKVSNVERHTRGLYLGKGAMFPTVQDDGSPVMAFELAKAQAMAARTKLRAAVAVVPQAPYFLSGSGSGAAANAQQPVHYVERWSIVVAEPKCALILDTRNKVLASADAGPAKGDAGGK
ncbi:hypothetical protein [uncultured Sphingomonas sp.]|uniref:hypothetical protein n=1 Tax=uncultured Sphingomonas sp. TaxID=158754 RepID=UPI0025887A20|nr:hypothetical protein [uncultured Sphingomonas sp.]